MHSSHPDPHDVGLVDGCPGCAAHAEHPMRSLDETMLRDLLARTLDNRFRDPTVSARSETEAVAMANVMNTLERVGKLAEVSPLDVAWYLSERWKVDLAAGTSILDRAEAEMMPRLAADYNAERRVREALRGYVVRRGEMVPGATAETWVQSAVELLNDLVVALGPECPLLESLVARTRREDLEP